MLAFKIITLVLLALVVTTSLAHALELPGKMRLSKEAYLATQQIYYPGFTFAGAAEPLGLLALLALTATTGGQAAFRLTLAALAALAAAHAVYWLWTHPVNNFWLKNFDLQGAGKVFFSFGAGRLNAESADWTALRDRWEYSHVARASLALLSFICLATAIAVG